TPSSSSSLSPFPPSLSPLSSSSPPSPNNLLHSLLLAIRRLVDDIWTTLRSAPHWRWRNALLFFAIVGVITSFFALLNFQGAVVSQVDYFIKRPIQIEATG